MRSLSRNLFFLLTITVLVSGCFTPDTPSPLDPLPAEQDEGEDQSKEPDPVSVVYRFPSQDTVRIEQWKNGSFSPEETGIAGGFITGSFVKHVELGELIPPDVPVRVQVSAWLDADEVPFVGPTGRMDPYNDGTSWYRLGTEKPGPGRLELQGIAKRAANGTFGLAIESYTPDTGSPPEVDYSIHLTIEHDPMAVPAGVPVALPMHRGKNITFTTDHENPAEVLVYAPDDTLATRLYFVQQTTWRPHSDGDHVIMVVHTPTDVTIAIELPSPDDETDAAGNHMMQALELTRDTGAPVPLAPLDTTGWTFDTEDTPLRVLLSVHAEEGDAWTCSGIITVRLDGPTESLIERAIECPSPTNVPFLYEEGWAWATQPADPRLAPGEYTVNIDADAWTGYRASHTVERYRR